jgi:type IV pilus assembly protein PilM
VDVLAKAWIPAWANQRLGSFGQRDPLIGLDIGSQAIKLVQLRAKHEKWHLQYCGIKSLPWPTVEEDGENSEMAIEDAIRKLVRDGHLHQTHVACSISGPSVMVKSIQVPIMTASELEEHLGWEMDQYIPSDASDIYWDYHIVDSGRREASEGMMSVLLVAAKKEAVHKRVELIQRSGLNPIVVDVDPLALSNMYAFNYEDGDLKRILLIHVSPSGVGMNVINEGIPVFIREIEVGGDGYRDLMEQSVRNPLEEKLTVNAAYSSDSSDTLLKEVYREVSKEVKKTIEYCCDMVPPHQIQKLFLGGGYARVPGLATTIEAEVNLPLEFIDPFKKLDVPSNLRGRELFQSFDLLGGVAIGLALRGIDDG